MWGRPRFVFGKKKLHPIHTNVAGQFHPTLYADIAGWGSTFEAGPKPYRHVPVQIVPPGDVSSVS
jgi:hypothetical protein